MRENREIEFRAWDKQDKRMLAISSFQQIPNNWRTVWELMQYTGLKDRNGKKIFEGDIVICGDGGENFSQTYDEEKDEFIDTHKAQVIGPTETYPAFEIDPNPCDDCNGLSQALATGTIEVIGNIYEHPDLLQREGV